MDKKNVFRTSMVLVIAFSFLFLGCSDEDAVENEDQTTDLIELKRASEVDMMSEMVSDIIIDSYENQESGELNRSAANVIFLPSCVTITIVAEQAYREITLDFGDEGCVINDHLLRGQIVYSYTRNVGAQEVLITYDLVDFYFDAKNVLGSRTIFKELANNNGNPQFTHTLDLTVIWPNGTQASREGEKVREWVEGYGSGVFSDNVFEITGNWSTTFVNGNAHTYEVIIPLRREVICNYFGSGSVDVQRTNFGGTFDYGLGDCDNQATFTFNNGNVIDVILN